MFPGRPKHSALRHRAAGDASTAITVIITIILLLLQQMREHALRLMVGESLGFHHHFTSDISTVRRTLSINAMDEPHSSS